MIETFRNPDNPDFIGVFCLDHLNSGKDLMNNSTDKVKRADSLKKRKPKNPFKQIQHRIEVVHEIYNSVRRYNSDEKNDGLDNKKESLINHDFSKTYRPQSP